MYRLFLSKDNKEKNPLGHEIIKKILVIPLLPASKANEAVELVLKDIELKFVEDETTLRYGGNSLLPTFEVNGLKK